MARQPKQISLLDVIEAIDGPINVNECVLHPESCIFSDDCPAHNVWCDIQDNLVNRLSATHFAQLLEKEKKTKVSKPI